MPELRSGVRRARLRSSRLEDVQAADQVATPVLPAPRGRGGRRGGGGAAGRGNKKAAAAGRGRPAPKARGKRVEAIDLIDQPFEDIPEAIVGEAVAGTAQQDLGLNKVADRAANFKMEGASGDRLAVAEDEATTTPVPERV
jgi:hypothetical protein